jgi:acyl carrier protein phosphodiesterase
MVARPGRVRCALKPHPAEERSLNFIGHLFVARWQREDDGFGLGAMLPDFAGMTRVRLAASAEESVQAGIALHHATDQVFHDSEPFMALMAQAFQALTQLGVARGPARAVAHVGVEMLIDGELLKDAALEQPYLAALHALAFRVDDLVNEPAERARLSTLARRLNQHGVPHDYRNIEAVTRRLELMLAHRPRLALDAAARRAVLSALPAIQETLTGRLHEIVNVLATALRMGPVLVR